MVHAGKVEVAASSIFFELPFTGRVPPRFWQVQPSNNTILHDAITQFEPYLAYKRIISLLENANVNHIGQEEKCPVSKDMFFVGVTVLPCPCPSLMSLLRLLISPNPRFLRRPSFEST